MKVYVINVSPNARTELKGFIMQDDTFEYVPSPVEDWEMIYAGKFFRDSNGTKLAYPSYNKLTSYYDPTTPIIEHVSFLSNDKQYLPPRMNPYLYQDGLSYSVDKSSIRAFILNNEAQPGDMILFYSSLSKLTQSKFHSTQVYFIGYLVIEQIHTFRFFDQTQVQSILTKAPHLANRGAILEALVTHQNPEVEQTRRKHFATLNHTEVLDPVYHVYQGTSCSTRFDKAIAIAPHTVEFMFEGGTYNPQKDYFELDGKVVVNKKGKISFFRHFHAKTMAIQYYLEAPNRQSKEFSYLKRFWEIVQDANPHIPPLEQYL